MGFKKTVEDFTCDTCGTFVSGTGYTNHCPKCLWSKHVDVKPGDRAEPCHGMMRPVAIEGSTPNYFIVHECERCKLRRPVRAAKDDSAEAILQLVRAIVQKS